MIKKLQKQYVTFILSIVTFLLSLILLCVIISTHIIYRQESISTLRNIPNIQISRFIPYLSIEVDKSTNIMLVDGNYYENTDTSDFQRLVELAQNSNLEIGVLRDYNLRFLHIEKKYSDIYNFIDITNEIYALKHLRINCLYIGAISLIVFFVLSVLLVKYMTRPVEKAWIQQKQFVGDASHELKTPLTVILTNSELLEDDKSSDSDKKQYVNNIHTMSIQMRGLVEQLLELARTDNGTMKTTFETFSLSDVIDTEVMIFEPSFFDKGLLLESDISADISVYGNSDRIKQVVDIFLDNAIKYTKNDGKVHVSLKSISSNRCQLIVESEGSPLDKKEVKNIFKRFYRADQARSNNGSYGLGLSIAKNIIDEHNGKIYAKPLKDGNAFIVELRKKKPICKRK